MKLGPDIKEALSGEITPKFLATLDRSGRPNCVPIITITPYDDETLVFGEFMMNKSRRNLLDCDKVAVATITSSLEAWGLEGTFLGFETNGRRFDFVNQLPPLRYNAYTGIRAAGAIRVEHVSAKETLGKAGLLCSFLRVSAMSRVLRPRDAKKAVMPRQVAGRFAQFAAVRAVAYVGADGSPRAFATMVCLAAGPNRLVLSDSLFNRHASQIAPGKEVAVAILTPDPIAYQVKGKYQGRKAGIGVVDLQECYSACPPLLGEPLHT